MLCGCARECEYTEYTESPESAQLVENVFQLLDPCELGSLDAVAIDRLVTAVHSGVQQSMNTVQQLIRSIDQERPHGQITKAELHSFLTEFSLGGHVGCTITLDDLTRTLTNMCSANEQQQHAAQRASTASSACEGAGSLLGKLRRRHARVRG